jgi:delta 1-pyrroline-5-carboxylate dehydrogenase
LLHLPMLVDLQPPIRPYLVRRLLENGANTSFVNRIADAHIALKELVQDPVATVEQAAARGPCAATLTAATASRSRPHQKPVSLPATGDHGGSER